MGQSFSLSNICKFSQEQYFQAVIKEDYQTVESHYEDFKDITDQSNEQGHIQGFTTMLYAIYLDSEKLFRICQKDQINDRTQRRFSFRKKIRGKEQNIILPDYSDMLSCSIFMQSKLSEIIAKVLGDQLIQQKSDQNNETNEQNKQIEQQYTPLQAIVIMNDIDFYKKLQQSKDESYRRLFQYMIKKETCLKRNAITLAAYYNKRDMIKEFYDLKNREFLNSVYTFLDLSLSPYAEQLASCEIIDQNIIEIQQKAKELEKKSRSNTGSSKQYGKTNSFQIHKRINSSKK